MALMAHAGWPILLGLLLAAPMSAKNLPVKGATLDLQIHTEKRIITDAQIEEAVGEAARTVVGYYGKFPVKELKVEVYPNPRQPNGFFGQAFNGRRVTLYVGSSAKPEKLRQDWILVHEMFHLGFPDLDDAKYNWIGEGLSTYLEGIARVRSGNLAPEKLWEDFLDGFADALPRPGDGGLNTERRYRREYWGGALFWFLMDLEIREKTKGLKSLDNAMLRILDEGGTGGMVWSLDELIDSLDKASGFPIGRRYYERFGPRPATEDLPALWKKLGIVKQNGKITFDPKAPLAATLKALHTSKN